jgi:hypothetical protein
MLVCKHHPSAHACLLLRAEVDVLVVEDDTRGFHSSVSIFVFNLLYWLHAFSFKVAHLTDRR